MTFWLGCGLGSYAEGDTLSAYGADESATDGSHTSDTDATDTDPEGAGSVFPLARGGIEIDRVQANQGVGVLIGADGSGVDPSERAAPLVKGRVTLIRAYWALPDDWEPREIEGRLTITQPDGSETIFSDTKNIEGEASEGDLSGSFFWGLTAEQIRPGSEFRVELFETSLEYDERSEPSPRVVLPAAGGNALLGVRPEELVMKVVLVPFEYDDGAGCVTAPDTSEDTMRRFQDAIYMQNPLERVDFEIHAPIRWDTPLTSFVPLNTFLAGLRFDEGAPPEAYYYGLIDVCADGLGNAGGMAIGIPDDPLSESAAALRVSSGLSIEPVWSAETFVHEIGHSQGRHHVACNGDEGGPDEHYPHAGGDLGEWGFGVVDFGLRNPSSHKDYMTYCHPAWVGAWGWNEVYPIIEGLSAWGSTAERSGAEPGPDPHVESHVESHVDPYEGSMLLGTIEPDGREQWLTVPGSAPVAGESSVLLEMHQGDALVARVRAHTQPMQDGDGGRLVMAPLPSGWSSVTTITRVEGDTRNIVPRGSIAEHHRSRAIRR
ncbi:MAG: hypothetical protein AAGF11_15855 [Myxococcota bacterium]